MLRLHPVLVLCTQTCVVLIGSVTLHKACRIEQTPTVTLPESTLEHYVRLVIIGYNVTRYIGQLCI